MQHLYHLCGLAEELFVFREAEIAWAHHWQSVASHCWCSIREIFSYWRKYMNGFTIRQRVRVLKLWCFSVLLASRSHVFTSKSPFSLYHARVWGSGRCGIHSCCGFTPFHNNIRFLYNFIIIFVEHYGIAVQLIILSDQSRETDDGVLELQEE